MKEKKTTGSIAAQLKTNCDIDIGAEFYMEMRGRNSLSVIGCCGIAEYSQELIGLILHSCILRINGKGLLCDSYTNCAVLVSGEISSVEIQPRENGK